MAMATATAMAGLLLLLLLLLLPRDAATEDPMHRALFDHIQQIRNLARNSAPAVVEDAGDWIGSSLVEEADAAEGDAAATDDLVQERLKVLQATFKSLKGDHSTADDLLKLHSRHSHDDDDDDDDDADLEEHLHGQDHDANAGFSPGVVEEADTAEGDSATDDVEEVVQERLKVLESALRTLKGDDSSADGNVVNLLERFKQESKLKLHSRHSHDEDDREEHLHGQDRRDFRHEHDHGGHSHGEGATKTFMLPEELAEEEDLLLYGFEGPGYASAQQPSRLRGPELGVWLRAMGCSLLVSLASLICLMLLPCIVSNGKPSEAIVNALASFGAGAMLGDAFLRQLPHAFGKSQSPHSHDTHQHHHAHGQDHSHSHDHDHASGGGQAHAHSFQDLSVGLAVLGGILLFFVVEKIVRRYEELSSYEGQRAVGHNRHHHQKEKTQLKKLEGPDKVAEVKSLEEKESKSLETKSSDIKKRNSGKKKDKTVADDAISTTPTQPRKQVEASGGFVIGYLNLFSDAVHNFTDGMALGSAFLLHGRVGGWSRTLFLLAHELPQEIGDFGILVKSGFSVFEALAFNFLSALVALAGTAVALMLGGSLGHSSFIEGFIAGGFIYMSVGGVVPSMHDQGSSLTSTLSQLVPMVFGMGVAVVISLAE